MAAKGRSREREREPLLAAALYAMCLVDSAQEELLADGDILPDCRAWRAKKTAMAVAHRTLTVLWHITAEGGVYRKPVRIRTARAGSVQPAGWRVVLPNNIAEMFSKETDIWIGLTCVTAIR